MTSALDQDSGGGLSPTARNFLNLRDPIMSRWEQEIRSRVEGADKVDGPILTNALPAFFDNIAEALSPDHPRQYATSDNNTAQAHGGERARMTQYGPDQLVHEYEILREAIEAELAGQLHLSREEWAIIDRSIYRAIRQAVKTFAGVQDQLRTKLAAALSHDMRTPLSLIVNAAELMKGTDSLDSAHRFASKIESHGRRLDSMMSDLLDALVSNGGDQLPLKITKIHIAALLEEVRKSYAESEKVNIQVKTSPIVGYWCGDALRRALENLINNAIKYGDGECVEIGARETRGRLMLSTRNTGAPIPKERQGQLFEYFGQKTAGAFSAGWGLGLPFVKRVAESHGGSVIVDSSAETGTTFVIDIPVDARPYVKLCDEGSSVRRAADEGNQAQQN